MTNDDDVNLLHTYLSWSKFEIRVDEVAGRVYYNNNLFKDLRHVVNK